MTDPVILDRAVVERATAEAIRVYAEARETASGDDHYTHRVAMYAAVSVALRAALSAGMDGYVSRDEIARTIREQVAEFPDVAMMYEDEHPARAACDAVAQIGSSLIVALAHPPLPEPAQQGETKPEAPGNYEAQSKLDQRSGPSPAPAQGQDVGVAMPATRESQLDPRNPNRLRLIPPEREATMPKSDGNAPEQDAERGVPKSKEAGGHSAAGAHAGLIARLEQVRDHDWRFSFLAHTSDTAGEAAAALREADAEMGQERAAADAWKALCETAERQRDEAVALLREPSTIHVELDGIGQFLLSTPQPFPDWQDRRTAFLARTAQIKGNGGE